MNLTFPATKAQRSPTGEYVRSHVHRSIENLGTIYSRAPVYGRSTLSAASLALRRSDIPGRSACIRARARRRNTTFVSLGGSYAVKRSTHRVRYGELTALIAVVN